MLTQAPRGTKDLFGEDILAWQRLEIMIRQLCREFGFSEIRTPIFEHTELFTRGVGETTDVVQKEMYTFLDKSGRSISLRPEITAGAARAYVENGMHINVQPTKLFYIGPNFRYETPQSGRLRQHHQFGVEIFGSYSPAAEAEIMSLGYTLLKRLGIENDVQLFINSLGCPVCRAAYHTKLKSFLGDNLQKLCQTCKMRFEKNPLRVLDCKEDGCKALMKMAPSVIDSLDDDCRKHFEDVQKILHAMNVPFSVDPKVVRGLDYYTRTVFEFIPVNEELQTMFTVIGGGRYDGLIEECGGTPTGGVGFGMGLERLLLFLKSVNKYGDEFAQKLECSLFIGHAGEKGFVLSQKLVYALRQEGITAESDLLQRSVKAQMKYANKINARFSMIIGDNEIEKEEASLKNMQTGEQINIALDIERIKEVLK